MGRLARRALSIVLVRSVCRRRDRVTCDRRAGSFGRRAAVDGTYTDEQVVTTSPLTTLAADTNGWQRFSVQFDAPGGRSVGIVVNPGFTGTLPAGRRVLELGAFMVEQVPGAAATSSLAATTSGRPSPYFDTTDVRERTLRVCEDTHGDVFRPTAWM